MSDIIDVEPERVLAAEGEGEKSTALPAVSGRRPLPIDVFSDILIGLTGPVDAHVDTIDVGVGDADEPAAVPEPRRSDPDGPGDQA